MGAPLAENEGARLEALRRYGILDSKREAAFERITRLAARLLNVPISLLSLVDEDRQWFKSAYGLNRRQTPRELSFCAHAILSDSVLVVPDAARDPRFETNELVTNHPRIRFYAGAPLTTPDGFKLGTLCALDLTPRDFTPQEQQLLADLAEIAMDELHLRVAVREKRQQLAAIQQLKGGVIVTDPSLPDNPIVFSNPAFTAISGYMPEQIIGRNCRFLQGPETDPEDLAEIRQAIKERRVVNRVIRNHRSTGEPFWNDLTIAPVFDEEGELSSFVGLQRDITPMKEAQEELARKNAELHRLQELRDSLTHMIIHDLRSPLSGVVGYLDLLKRRAAAKLDDKERGFVEIAYTAAQRLNEMITSLLDTNRLEAGEMPVQLQDADVVALVSRCVEDHAGITGTRRVTCDFKEECVVAHFDPELTRRVIGNLLGNAVKYTASDGEIALSVDTSGEHVCVAIRDNGRGIPPEFHRKIFEKFGQLDGGTRHSTGLGLTFCKLAVEAQDGTISVQSEPGAGSTFAFTLPRTRR